MCAPTQGVWQPAGCVSCEPVCVCVSLVRVVIICPASTHTALVSSPSLAVLHLTTYLPNGYPCLLCPCVVCFKFLQPKVIEGKKIDCALADPHLPRLLGGAPNQHMRVSSEPV